ncbi:hypothetical protein OROHE_006692 [Orobanche hederae]
MVAAAEGGVPRTSSVSSSRGKYPATIVLPAQRILQMENDMMKMSEEGPVLNQIMPHRQKILYLRLMYELNEALLHQNALLRPVAKDQERKLMLQIELRISYWLDALKERVPHPEKDEINGGQMESQMEAKVNRMVQENMTWFLKKLGEANHTLKFDIGDFCATFSSDQDETGTPITQTPEGATS